YNDLATIYPQLVLEWNYNKNSLLPHEIFPYSNKKVWWKCEKGHEWEDTPNHRVSRRNGCPYCSNHKLLEGYNDLTTTHPKLVDEWDYDKNGDLYPTKITFGSNKKIWWKCARGHEWQATVNSRSSGNNCPYCKKEMQTSFPFKIILGTPDDFKVLTLEEIMPHSFTATEL
ncbi:MAG: zinc-ribbon domain-containing protein, partial [Clostridia bacterium]|nr:zinc-ribbon domain-containing protein [Clostridia bacterium]